MRTRIRSGGVRRRRRSWDTAMSRYTNRMIAPEEFSRKEKTLSGDTAAAITQRNPTIDELRIAQTGTPRLFTVMSATGASRRPARTKSIREAVYRPELRQDSTAVRTTAFMTWSAYGSPILVKALT